MTSTHIRIPSEVKEKLDSLAKEGESAGAVISRLIEFFESREGVNNNVNIGVNEPPDNVNSRLTDEIITRLNDLEMWRDEISTRFDSVAALLTDQNDPEEIIPDTPETILQPLEVPCSSEGVTEAGPEPLEVLNGDEEHPQVKRIQVSDEMKQEMNEKIHQLREGA